VRSTYITEAVHRTTSARPSCGTRWNAGAWFHDNRNLGNIQERSQQFRRTLIGKTRGFGRFSESHHPSAASRLTILIQGESGTGKSSLLAPFTRILAGPTVRLSRPFPAIFRRTSSIDALRALEMRVSRRPVYPKKGMFDLATRQHLSSLKIATSRSRRCQASARHAGAGLRLRLGRALKRIKVAYA